MVLQKSQLTQALRNNLPFLEWNVIFDISHLSDTLG